MDITVPVAFSPVFLRVQASHLCKQICNPWPPFPTEALFAMTAVPSVAQSAPRVIRIAAALLLDQAGRTLLVRKRGTKAFMQAGGKIEQGEQPLAALARELDEELGLRFEPAAATYLGHFSAPAANEPGYEVQAEVFCLRIAEAVTAAAEIEEILWVDPLLEHDLPMAALTRERILPFYRQSLLRQCADNS